MQSSNRPAISQPMVLRKAPSRRDLVPRIPTPPPPPLSRTLASKKSSQSLYARRRPRKTTGEHDHRVPKPKKSVAWDDERVIQRHPSTASFDMLKSSPINVSPSPTSKDERKFNLDVELGSIMYHSMYLQFAFKDADTLKLRKTVDMFDYSMSALIRKMDDLPPSVRVSQPYVSRFNAIAFQKTVFVEAVRAIPIDMPPPDLKLEILRCVVLRDVLLGCLKQFLLVLDTVLNDPRGLPSTEEFMEYDEPVTFPTAHEKNPLPVFPATEDDEETYRRTRGTLVVDCSVEDVYRASARASGLYSSPEKYSIRDSVTAAWNRPDAPKPHTLWDVHLPYSSAAEGDITFGVRNDPTDVKTASVFALIHYLTTDGGLLNEDFLDTFFLCFRHFSTAKEIAKAFIARYSALPPSNLTKEQKEAWKFRAPAIQIHVINCLRMWAQFYWRDGDQDALRLLLKFASQIVCRDWAGAGLILVNALENTKTGSHTRRYERRQQEIRVAHPQHVAFPSRSTLKLEKLLAASKVDIKAFQYGDSCLELARQLTLLSAGIFRTVRPEDLMVHFGHSSSCSCAVKAQLSHIAAFYDGISCWVSRTILEQADMNDRNTVLMVFVTLATHCLADRNYAGTVSITHGLSDASIGRLGEDNMSLKSSGRAAYDHLVLVSNMLGNYRRVRAHLDSQEKVAATVPVMTVFLQIMEQLQSGDLLVPSKVSPKTKIPAFWLYRSATRNIRLMELWHMQYPHPKVSVISSWLESNINRAVKVGVQKEKLAVMELSLTIQPDLKKEKVPKSSILATMHLPRVLGGKKPTPDDGAPKDGVRIPEGAKVVDGKLLLNGKPLFLVHDDRLPPDPPPPKLPSINKLPGFKKVSIP